MIDALFQKATTSVNTIKDVLGNMHSNRYYAPADPTYWPKIAGVASMWGGFAIPKPTNGDAAFFKTVSASANPPLIAFHGAKDTTVNFYDNARQYVNLSTVSAFRTENLCTLGNNCPTTPNGKSFTQKTANAPQLKICSSLNLYRVMKDADINKFSELYVDCSMAHGLDDDCATCDYESTFGTNAANAQATLVYLAARIAVFSHAVMKYSPPQIFFGAAGRSYFKDCENKRTCSQTTKNYSCTGTDLDTLCDGTPIFP